MSPRHTLLALLVVLIWGLNFVVIHFGLQGFPPLLFVAIRFLVILPVLVLVPRPAVPWRSLLLVGLFMSAGQFGLLYSAMAIGLPAGLASLVMQAQVLFTALFATVVLKEPPTLKQAVGVVVGAGGLAIVAAGRQAATLAVALGLTLAAAACWAAGNIVSRGLGRVSGLGVTVWSAVVVPWPLFLASVALEGMSTITTALSHISAAAVLSTAYTAGLSTLVAYGIWNSLLGRYPASAVAPFTLLVPVVGISAAWLILGERPNAWELTGGLALLLGVAIAVVNPGAMRGRGRRTA